MWLRNRPSSSSPFLLGDHGCISEAFLVPHLYTYTTISMPNWAHLYLILDMHCRSKPHLYLILHFNRRWHFFFCKGLFPARLAKKLPSPCSFLSLATPTAPRWRNGVGLSLRIELLIVWILIPNSPFLRGCITYTLYYRRPRIASQLIPYTTPPVPPNWSLIRLYKKRTYTPMAPYFSFDFSQK